MIRILDFDLSLPTPQIPLQDGPTWIFVRAGEQPLGEVRFDRLDAATSLKLRELLIHQFSDNLYALLNFECVDTSHEVSVNDMTLAVCTRDRTEFLERWLDAVARLDPPPGEILVVDNASTTDGNHAVCQRAGVRYLSEPQPGLSRARNAAWRNASRELIAYVDDDAMPSCAYARAIAEAFISPQIAAVTGLVIPGELNTDAQYAFERFAGGMSRGYESRLFSRDASLIGLEAFQVGVGANMAFRRAVLEAVGGFDERFGAGTPVGGGEDLDIFYRLLRAGHVIHYSPKAFVRHIHRRSRSALLAQMNMWGLAFSAFLAKRAAESAPAAREVRRYRRRWHMSRHVREPIAALRHRQPLRFRMAIAEARGSLRGASLLRSSEGRNSYA